jgi:hypothetical protein
VTIADESNDIGVRLVHTPEQVVRTIRTGDSDSGFLCITPVPGHSELVVTGDENGNIHLWDIEDKGVRACECMNVTAGAHVRKIEQLENRVNHIVASSTRLMCSCDYNMKMAIVHFDSEKSS